jgi:hypothetical protein
MKRTCRYEAATTTAVRRGALTHEVLEHVAACDACREASAVAEMFVKAAGMHEAVDLPASHAVWSRLNERRRELTLRRAALAILWLRVMTGVYGAGLAVWFLARFATWRSGFTAMLRPFENNALAGGLLLVIASIAAGSVLLVKMAGPTRRIPG